MSAATVITEGFGTFGTVAFVITSGFGTAAAAPPEPPPAVSSGTANSGGTNWRDWRWYDGQESRPNWYAYPEVKQLKREILAVAKKKKKIERQLSFAKRDDFGPLLASLNELQEKLAALMERYRQMLAAWQAFRAKAAAEDEEEAEFMDLLTEIL